MRAREAPGGPASEHQDADFKGGPTQEGEGSPTRAPAALRAPGSSYMASKGVPDADTAPWLVPKSPEAGVTSTLFISLS